MGALERFDEWEAGLGEEPEPTTTAFDELYDVEVLHAIDTRAGEPRTRVGPLRTAAVAVAAGAAATGLARGLRDGPTEDGPDPDQAGEIEVAPVERRLEPVTVILVPGDPAASVAIVRRWLF